MFSLRSYDICTLQQVYLKQSVIFCMMQFKCCKQTIMFLELQQNIPE